MKKMVRVFFVGICFQFLFVSLGFAARIVSDSAEDDVKSGELVVTEDVSGVNFIQRINQRAKIADLGLISDEIWFALAGLDKSLLNDDSETQVRLMDELLKKYPNHRIIRERSVFIYLANHAYDKAATSAELLISGSVNSYPWRSYATSAHFLRGRADLAGEHIGIMKFRHEQSPLGILYTVLSSWDETSLLKFQPFSAPESAFLLRHILEHQNALSERLGKKSFYYLCGVILGGGLEPHSSWGQDTWKLSLDELAKIMEGGADALAKLHHISVHGVPDLSLLKNSRSAFYLEGPGIELIHGVFLSKKGDVDQAKEVFSRLYSNYPDLFDSGLRLFFALLDSGNVTEAEDLGARLKEKKPESPYNDLVDICLLVQQNEIEDAKKAISLAKVKYANLFQRWIQGDSSYMRKIRWLAFHDFLSDLNAAEETN